MSLLGLQETQQCVTNRVEIDNGTRVTSGELDVFHNAMLTKFTHKLTWFHMSSNAAAPKMTGWCTLDTKSKLSDGDGALCNDEYHGR